MTAAKGDKQWTVSHLFEEVALGHFRISPLIAAGCCGANCIYLILSSSLWNFELYKSLSLESYERTMSQLEQLQPETQSLIMCHIPCATTLHSLLRASPRFYQVFLSRRGYHLTQLAVRHSLSPANAWDAIQASEVSKSSTYSVIEKFLSTFMDDEGYEASILPLEKSLPMIKLGAQVAWFVTDLARDCLANLITLGELLGLEQNSNGVQRDLSEIEKQRIARAFFRFETYRQLFPPESMFVDVRISDLTAEFLSQFDMDEIEEIMCVGDYIIRRLWGIFDRMEDDFVRGEPLEPLQKAAKIPDKHSWFGSMRKAHHKLYLQNLMSLGLPILREIITADPARSADLVLSNDLMLRGYLTAACSKVVENGIEPSGPPGKNVPYLRTHKSPFREDLSEYSYGWRWGQNLHNNAEPGNEYKKGCRDWGYVFWDRTRMIASGVRNQE